MAGQYYLSCSCDNLKHTHTFPDVLWGQRCPFEKIALDLAAVSSLLSSLNLRTAFSQRSRKTLLDKDMTSSYSARTPKLSVLNLNEATLPSSEDVGNMVVTWVPEGTEKNMRSVGKSSVSNWPEKKRKKLGEKTRSSLYFSGKQYVSAHSRSPGVIVPPPSPVHLFDQLSSDPLPLWAQVSMLHPDLLQECILAHEKTIAYPEVKIELSKMRKDLPMKKSRPDSAISSTMYLTIHRLTLQRPSLRYPEHQKLQYNLKRGKGAAGTGPSGHRKQQKQQKQQKQKQQQQQQQQQKQQKQQQQQWLLRQRQQLQLRQGKGKGKTAKEQEAKKKAKSEVELQSSHRILPEEESVQMHEKEIEEKEATTVHDSVAQPVLFDFDKFYKDYYSMLERSEQYDPESDVDDIRMGILSSRQEDSSLGLPGSPDKMDWNPELKLLRILQSNVEDDENNLSRTHSEASLEAKD
ncbi:uncharacterized protein C9orf43 homolog isoform X2 [Psammomys obesus]|uniref:uncharacterized protein C9orf43 homolog isoform X2 n=1 Tax=Psammomys obesus TaxID=48139 RepID=UPI00245315F9|nr:uncharacterized protein C9orf43 homolog isoform X2 [Psammomys obesus]